MVEVIFPDERQPTPLTDAEVAMRKLLAGVKLANHRWDYTERFRERCAELRVEWAWTRPELRRPKPLDNSGAPQKRKANA